MTKKVNRISDEADRNLTAEVTVTIRARYENGVFRPLEGVSITDGTIVEIHLQPESHPNRKRRSIKDLPFYGMWADRDDITDGVSYVDADNAEGAKKAVNYLLGSGRAAVATIAGPPDMAPGIDRLLGYRKAITAAGIHDPGMIAYGDYTRRSGEHALRRLIDHRPRLDAVFVASDLMAVGAMDALGRLGRRVPKDVAVLGFDDLPLSQYTKPRLSTVRQPVDAMAAQMVREMLALVDDPGRSATRVVLETELVLRDSA